MSHAPAAGEEVSMAKRRRVKVRITTWVDRDVLMWLKVRGLETRMGYQTLMNRMLQEAIARAEREAQAPPPVSRSEYESVLSALSDLESRLEGLKAQVRTAEVATPVTSPVKSPVTPVPADSPPAPARSRSRKGKSKTARKPARKLARKPTQRRFSQNSTS